MEEKPIRVLHVVRCLEQGGIQNLLMNLYRNIDRDKIQFDFLVSDEGVFEEEIKELGGMIYQIPYITKVGEKKYQRELMDFLQQHKQYKIIHCHLNQISGVVLEVAKKLDIPVRIAHAHTMKNTNSFIIKMYKMYLQKKITQNATHLFACSKEAAKWMFRKEGEKAIILNNGIEIDKFLYSQEKREKIRKKLDITEDVLVIGHIGRFSKVKNQSFMLDIFSSYLKRNSNSILVLVGEGETKEKIRKKAKKLQLSEKVKLIDNTKEVEDYYSSFDCFLFPSLFEGLGIVLIEAQINGLNCLASDQIPKQVEISEHIKFISLKENASYWAKQIQKSNREIKYNKENVDQYDIVKISKQLEDFYEIVMK